MTAAERFWKKVERGLSDECWLWKGGTNAKGYGRFTAQGRRSHRIQVQAHRFAYELLIGPIPEGLTIDHLCEVKACVNPSHLRPATVRHNLLRGNSPSSINSRKTHCHIGHEFTEENTVWVKTPTGRGRKCRICAQTKHRERQLAKKALA